MKYKPIYFVVLLLLSIVFVSCTTPRLYFNQVEKYPLTEYREAIFKCDSIRFISNQNFYASNLDSIKKFHLSSTKYKLGDKIRYFKSYNYKSNQFNDDKIVCYQIELNSDTIWVFNPNVITIELENQLSSK